MTGPEDRIVTIAGGLDGASQIRGVIAPAENVDRVLKILGAEDGVVNIAGVLDGALGVCGVVAPAENLDLVSKILIKDFSWVLMPLWMVFSRKAEWCL